MLEATMKDPEFMSDPKIQELFHIQTIKNNWDSLSSNGKSKQTWNTPTERLKSLQERQGMINKYYDEQTNQANKSAQDASVFGKKDYQNTVDSLNQGLQSDTQKLTNDSASSGAIRSTAYNDMRNSLASQYTNKYKAAYDKASQSANTTGNASQEQLGYSAPTPTYEEYGANVSGNNITPNLTGNNYKYNPFNQMSGSIQRDRTFQIKNLSAKNL